MRILRDPRILVALAKQVRQPALLLPKVEAPTTIHDNNQAINLGVINEAISPNLRSEISPRKKRGRPPKRKD